MRQRSITVSDGLPSRNRRVVTTDLLAFLGKQGTRLFSRAPNFDERGSVMPCEEERQERTGDNEVKCLDLRHVATPSWLEVEPPPVGGGI